LNGRPTAINVEQSVIQKCQDIRPKGAATKRAATPLAVRDIAMSLKGPKRIVLGPKKWLRGHPFGRTGMSLITMICRCRKELSSAGKGGKRDDTLCCGSMKRSRKLMGIFFLRRQNRSIFSKKSRPRSSDDPPRPTESGRRRCCSGRSFGSFFWAIFRPEAMNRRR